MSNLHLLAGQAVRQALESGRTVATAESLTAGMVSAVLADTPGASGMLQGGVIAYQNSVKESVLHVPADLLASAGSVDPDVARAMAAGARTVLGADVGISTTGVAGPDAHDGKPVGAGVRWGCHGGRNRSFRILLYRQQARHQGRGLRRRPGTAP